MSVLKHFLTICLSLAFVTYGFGQTVGQTIAFAKHSEEVGDYQTAISSYRRAFFFDGGSNRYELSTSLARCYTAQGQYGQADYFFDLAYTAVPDGIEKDSIKAEVLFDKAEMLIIAGEYKFAELELLSIPKHNRSSQHRKLKFYTGIIRFQQGNYDEAKSNFEQLLGEDQEARNELEQYFKKNQKLNWYNPKRARIMSMVVPGLGQLWCGDIKNGINSLALNVGFGTLFILVAGEFSLFEAILGILPWYERYYIGGFQGAYQIALEKQHKKRDKIYQSILLTLKAVSK